MAAGGWGKEQVAHDAKAVRLFCQHLSLYSQWVLPIEDDEGLQAIAFAWLPADTNDTGQWLRERFPLITEEQRRTLLTNEGYLMRTDKARQKMILPDSAKHSFFISRKPGYGTPPYWNPFSSGRANVAWHVSIAGPTAPATGSTIQNKKSEGTNRYFRCS